MLPNKCFIHSPAKQKAKAFVKTSAYVKAKTDFIGCGIVDKTKMYEAANQSGMDIAIWVKYSLSLFHNNYGI